MTRLWLLHWQFALTAVHGMSITEYAAHADITEANRLL